VTDNASIPLLVHNALKEGGGGDDYNKVVEELKMISAKPDEIQYPQSEQDEGKNEDRKEEDGGSRYTSTMLINLHLHEGEYIHIHPDFIFPKNCSLRDIVFRFHLKDLRNGILPLRVLDATSVRHRKRGKSTLSDIRYLMRHLENAANEIGKTCNRLSSQREATELFEEIKDSLYQHDEKESERAEQYKWATWVRKIRRARRARY